MAIINGRGRVGIRRPSAAATPSIVLDGLKLYLDAGKATSYAGTGTAWTDLSGNGNNATLVNGGSGLTFSNLNSGEIYFDGSNDYVIFDSPKPATTLSIGVWFNSSVIDNAWRKIFLLPYHNSSNTSRLSPYSSYQIVTVSSKIGVDFNVDANYMSNRVEDATTVPLANTWYYVCGTFNSGVIKIYVNGALKNTKDISSRGTSIMYSNGTRGIMGVTSYVQLVEQYRGKISNAHVYSKVLSDAEVLQNFDLMKARFYPQVSDADAQSFIYAAGIQDSTQGNAVNTLVTSLKSAGIWTKMKAVYPFVGGSAASHKFNLKDPRDLDAAFRLAFTAGWVHTSTGAKPNGTSDYADTKFIPATNFTAGAGHISYYSRTNSFGVKRDISAYGSGNIYSYSRFDSANSGWFRFSGAEVGYSNSDSRGWYMMSRTSTNSYFYKNAIYKAGGASSTFGASVISIGGGTAGTYSDREIAFASIGDYLTDAENASFCAIVQTYQTSLGRQV